MPSRKPPADLASHADSALALDSSSRRPHSLRRQLVIALAVSLLIGAFASVVAPGLNPRSANAAGNAPRQAAPAIPAAPVDTSTGDAANGAEGGASNAGPRSDGIPNDDQLIALALAIGFIVLNPIFQLRAWSRAHDGDARADPRGDPRLDPDPAPARR